MSCSASSSEYLGNSAEAPAVLAKLMANKYGVVVIYGVIVVLNCIGFNKMQLTEVPVWTCLSNGSIGDQILNCLCFSDRRLLLLTLVGNESSKVIREVYCSEKKAERAGARL